MRRERTSDGNAVPAYNAGEGPEAPEETSASDSDKISDSESLRALSEEISRESPLRLDHTALVLYDRDPEHLQAQWYVAPKDLTQAQHAFPANREAPQQVLRLRRMDRDGRTEVVSSTHLGAGVSSTQGEESLSLGGAPSVAGAEYECELGLETDDGGWLLLARSNRVGVSDLSPAPQAAAASPGFDQAQKPEGAGAGGLPDYSGIYIDAALAAVGGPLHPVFPSLDLDDELATGGFSSGEQTLDPQRPWAPSEETSSVTMGHQAPSPESMSGFPREADILDMPPPLLPSTQHQQPEGALFGSLYDPRAALSSAAPGGVSPPASDMELHAELIVHGRADPGSKIDLFGQAVPVGADGRFYIRRPITDPQLLSLLIGGRPPAGKGTLDS